MSERYDLEMNRTHFSVWWEGMLNFAENVHPYKPKTFKNLGDSEEILMFDCLLYLISDQS